MDGSGRISQDRVLLLHSEFEGLFRIIDLPLV
jgi:hypothetical protein